MRAIALEAIKILRARKEDLCFTSQILAEFWNVCTRPITARGGLGQPLDIVDRKVKLIERHFRFLPENNQSHDEWRRLLVTHKIIGVQVYDARLVAIMNAHQVANLLTFNTSDFRRYSQITAISPSDVKPEG